MSERVDKKLFEAIQTMRSFCDDAVRVINDAGRTDANKIGQVIHQLSWGFANASSSIECANAQVEHDNERNYYDMLDKIENLTQTIKG